MHTNLLLAFTPVLCAVGVIIALIFHLPYLAVLSFGVFMTLRFIGKHTSL